MFMLFLLFVAVLVILIAIVIEIKNYKEYKDLNIIRLRKFHIGKYILIQGCLENMILIDAYAL